jgi:hypothetical protein
MAIINTATEFFKLNLVKKFNGYPSFILYVLIYIVEDGGKPCNFELLPQKKKIKENHKKYFTHFDMLL